MATEEPKKEDKKGGGFYAWTTIKYGAKVDPNTGVALEYEYVKPGDSVSATQLFPNHDADRAQVEFDALCLGGAVRAVPYPDDYPLDSDQSIRDFLVAKATAADEWEGINASPGGYTVNDDLLAFNAVEREAQAAREGSPVMASTAAEASAKTA